MSAVALIDNTMTWRSIRALLENWIKSDADSFEYHYSEILYAYQQTNNLAHKSTLKDVLAIMDLLFLNIENLKATPS